MDRPPTIISYVDLEVWQVSMDLVVECYGLAERFPPLEQYGLRSQLRRAAVSVPANIAEGHARRRTREFLHHLDIAYGSLAETETHIRIAERLGYVSHEATVPAFDMSGQVGRMLNRLIQSLKSEEQSA